MLSEKQFYDVPVYRLSKDKYQEWRNDQMNLHLRGWREMGREPPRETSMWVDDHIYQKYGPWDFNEVIAYIRLYFFGNQIRAEYFSAEKQRNPVSRTKTFTYRTWKLAPEVTLWPSESVSNEYVWGKILEYLQDCQNYLIRGRVIDLSKLELIGPHVNWLELLNWRQS